MNKVCKNPHVSIVKKSRKETAEKIGKRKKKEIPTLFARDHILGSSSQARCGSRSASHPDGSIYLAVVLKITWAGSGRDTSAFIPIPNDSYKIVPVAVVQSKVLHIIFSKISLQNRKDMPHHLF